MNVAPAIAMDKPTPPATPRPDELMTLQEAAVVLHVHYETVRLWVAKGVFPRVVRVGPAGAIRLYRADVQAQRVEQRGFD